MTHESQAPAGGRSRSSPATDTWRRVALLVPPTLLGMCIGLLGDVLAGDMSLSLGDILVPLMFFPMSVIGVAGMTGVPAALMICFMIGGCLFCPVYASLAVFWVIGRHRWALLALVPWCAQAGFQIVHRFEVLMSV